MRHLAVIMDGNGRWAKARRVSRLSGHRAGAEALDRLMHYCREAGIRYLTVYAFSTENWKRSTYEVDGLKKLLSTYLRTKGDELRANGVRFRVIGRRADLPHNVQKGIATLEEKTKDGTFTLCVALSYGGRAEIIDAAQAWRQENPEGVLTEDVFRRYLYAPDIPDPDLIIRTSGECRTSNFLLWESAYSEYYFTDVFWPDFDKAEFDRALESYAKRERRMGGRLENEKS
jgi:undecaprenyl diphosphate synthase